MEESIEEHVLEKGSLKECLLVTDGKWTILEWFNKQHDNDETTEVPKVTELPEVIGQAETQKDPDILTQTDRQYMVIQRRNTIEKLHENTDSDNTSNDISVITESEKDVVNKHFSKTRQLKDISRYKHIITTSGNKIKVPEIATFIIVGILIGFFIGFPLTYYNIYPYKTEIKSLKAETSIIINAYKEVTEALNEIRAYIQVDKINREHVWQHRKINHSNMMSNKFISKSLNYHPYLLDRFQVSLSMLSSLINDIYGDNNLFKNEMTKTLDIVNDTKVFYETLISFNNTQNMDNSAVAQFLQSATDTIRHTSRSLVSDVVKKIRKIMLNSYNEYNKVVLKLRDTLCHLKNILPGELLEQLIGNSRLLSDYEKYCILNNTQMEFNVKTKEIKETKIKNVKEQTKGTSDVMLNTKYDEDIRLIDVKEQITDDILENSSNSIETKSQDIHQASQLTDSCSKLNTNMPIVETTSMNEIENHRTDYNIKCNVMPMNYKQVPAKILSEERTMKKQEDRFESYVSTKKVSNYENVIIGEENIPRQIKNRVLKSTHDKQKDSFNKKTTQWDSQQTTSADWQFKRSRARESLRRWSHSPKQFPSLKQYPKVDFKTVANIHDKLMQDVKRSIDKMMRTFKEKTSEILEWSLKKRDFSKKKW